MNVVVGIDLERRYRPAIRLLSRLRLPLDEVLLAHSIETSTPAIESTDDAASEPVRIDYDEAVAALCEARTASESLFPHVQTELLAGMAADALIELSDGVSADLVAVQSERKGPFRSFFMGSVSRGLAIASRRSLLISKGDDQTDSPIRAVFATDHSPYCTAALEEFLRLRPSGVASVHVVSAVAMSDYMFWATHLYLSPGEDHASRLQVEIQRRSDAILERLRAAGYEATSATPICCVIEAIADAMADADLLIMGAQGHGFVERLLIGSNSLHQVIIEPHPVLLMRPPTAV